MQVRPSPILLKLLLAIGSFLLGVFLMELALLLVAPANELEGRARAARELGLPFDSRSRLEVVEALRKTGVEAWPTMKPYLMLTEESRHRATRRPADGGQPAPFLLPLGGISTSTSVYCNEGGEYSIFETDEHGFRNPLGAHRVHPVDAVIVGDSFGNGACVATGQDPASVLVAKGLSTVSLASPGNGPLIELATLVEYAAPLEPRTVLWLYFEGNDLKNLTDEIGSETLSRYLTGPAPQHLRSRQPEIDIRLRELSNRWEDVARAEEERAWLRQLRVLLTLYHVRRLMGFGSPEPDYDRAAKIFCEVIEQAESVVEAWGGRMVFVYLPSWYRYAPGKPPPALALKPTIEKCARRNGLAFVDFERVISESADPMSFFAIGINPHYNAGGYRRLAEAILSELSGR